MSLRFIYFYYKVRYTQRRRDREKDLPSNGSLQKWPKQLELSQSKARSLLWVSHTGAGSLSFGPSLTAFPGHKQGVGWEAELPGLELAPIWDPGVFKVRMLAARPPHWARPKLTSFLLERQIYREKEIKR